MSLVEYKTNHYTKFVLQFDAGMYNQRCHFRVFPKMGETKFVAMLGGNVVDSQLMDNP